MTALLSSLTVDLEAIADNYRRLAARHRRGRCAAVVKANAYGLGMGPVAKRLRQAGCDTFFVATLEEGLTLRKAADSWGPETGPAPRIYVFAGPVEGEEREYVAYRLAPVLNAPGQVERWRAAVSRAGGAEASAALHVDTGMHRLGLAAKELERLGDAAALAAACRLSLLMSHLACASEPEHPLNAEQNAAFAAMRARFSMLPASLANSAGLFLDASFHYDLGRPGCALYGITPNRTQKNPMRHVATLKGRILQIREIECDGTIGYGATAEVREGMRVAIVALGYADGAHRIASGRLGGYVSDDLASSASGDPLRRSSSSHGMYRVPMLGRISMDLTCFDVTHVPPLLLAREPWVTLIGERQNVDTVAGICHTIGYEIFTRIGNRVTRIYGNANDEP